MKQQITAGETHSVRYPFAREEVELCDGPATGWRPGCRSVQNYDDFDFIADGHGEMLLTVVSTHKPGKFPERVFYTRQWKDPDGRVFGKGALRNTTAGNFRKLLRGYRHEYEQPNAEVTAGGAVSCPMER